MLSSCGDISFSCEAAEQLQPLSLLFLLLLHGVDQVTDVVYVVAEEDTGEEGEDDEQQCLRRVGCVEITEPDCENDGGSEIVAPDVLLAPGQEIEAAFGHPAVLLGPGDPEERDCEEMAN